jgi:hypothetical protein
MIGRINAAVMRPIPCVHKTKNYDQAIRLHLCVGFFNLLRSR